MLIYRAILIESLYCMITRYTGGEWRESLERDNEYMSHSALPFIPDIDITGGSRKNREDDLPPLKRKKKHKNNDLSL